MPPRLRLPSISSRNLVLRTRPACHNFTPVTARRTYSKSTDLPVSEDGQGPNQETLPSVSEEAISMDKARGQSGPDLTQGTSIQEIAKRDPEAQKHLPKDIKEAIKDDASSAGGSGSGSVPDGKRQFSTTAFRRDLQLAGPQGDASGVATLNSLLVAGGVQTATAAAAETKEITLESELDMLPALKPEDVFTRRYPAVIDQMVGLMMQDGKKGAAQKNVALILNLLRTSPPPKIRADRPLLPGHPSPSWLPLNPVDYLTLAIDSLAPVIRLRAQKGQAGGGAALTIPVPIAVRQRRRTAIMWIIDAASKRRDKTFAHRVADQIVAVVEGRSALWDRRSNLHKLGVASRSNVNYSRNRRKKAM